MYWHFGTQKYNLKKNNFSKLNCKIKEIHIKIGILTLAIIFTSKTSLLISCWNCAQTQALFPLYTVNIDRNLAGEPHLPQRTRRHYSFSLNRQTGRTTISKRTFHTKLCFRPASVVRKVHRGKNTHKLGNCPLFIQWKALAGQWDENFYCLVKINHVEKKILMCTMHLMEKRVLQCVLCIQMRL